MQCRIELQLTKKMQNDESMRSRRSRHEIIIETHLGIEFEEVEVFVFWEQECGVNL